jgi:predicted transcriptional regulator
MSSAAARWAALNSFADASIRSLSRAEIAVWLSLFRDAREGLARTGQEDLATRCGIDRRSVYRAIVSLRRRGMIEIVRQGRLRSGPSVYRVHPVPKQG